MIEETLLNNLASSGILGAVLAWFMLRNEKHLVELKSAYVKNTEVLATFTEVTRKCTGGKK